ncbi:MAG: metal ABC transporter permease [Christensenellales bacterium]
MIEAVFTYTFLRNALIAAVLASITGGIIGAVAIEKKLISMSGGIAHASFGGIGLGYLVGFEPIWGGLAFAVGASALIAKMPSNARLKADTMTGILWSFGMALGILFISLRPGYVPDMTSYLFGDILSVSTDTLIYMAAFTGAVVVVFTVFYRHLILYIFDEEYAAATGIRTGVLKWIVYIIIPVGIIVLLKIVGILLTIALMTIPVSAAKMLCNSFGRVVVISVFISLIFCLAGLVVSYYINIPSGVCIIVISTVIYLFMLMMRGGVTRWIHSRTKHHSRRLP